MDTYTDTVYLFKFYVTAWVSLFLSLGGIYDGYGKANITPYIHGMVYHVPPLMRIHNGIRNFSGQGLYIFPVFACELEVQNILRCFQEVRIRSIFK